MKEIVQDGAPVLREVAKPVPKELFGTAKLANLIEEMKELLDREEDGVALAAPQIGSPYRIFIVRTDRTVSSHELPENGVAQTPAPHVEVYINPEIIKTSRKRALADEGCLSVRGVYGKTNRHERVTVRAQRLDGSKIERGAGGLMAQIFEHEIDHLNGILFTDHAEHIVRIPPETAVRYAYFGSPKVAHDTLEILIDHGFVPTVVVTSPDAKRGRGLVSTPQETKVLAEDYDLPVFSPDTLDDKAIAHIRAYKCDYAIVVAYGKIFPEELIAAFPKGVLNIHYSLLPKYRGAAPLEAALLAHETNTGVTVQKMARELDAGDVLAQEAIPIAPTDAATEVRERLIRLGAKLLIETLPGYLQGGIVPVPQDSSQASYAHKRKKEDGLLTLADPDKINWGKYRAYEDTIGTYFFDNGKRIKITAARLEKGKFVIERVIPEGKREMPYDVYLSGLSAKH